jgi:hypothetical protein
VPADARETLGKDDTQSYTPAPNSRLLSAEERACQRQAWADSDHDWSASNAQSLHQTLRASRTPQMPCTRLTW